MIRYTIADSGSLRLEQFELAPTVYLDHWAVRLMSEDSSARRAFVSTLKARSGTLMLSWLNLIEFIQVADSRAHQQAEEFIEQVLPNVFFMEINPFQVISRENQLLAGGTPFPPHADCNFMKEFACLGSDSLSGFTAAGLFQPMHGSKLDAEFCELADVVIDGIQAQRDEHTGNVNFQRIIRRPPSGPKIQRGTRYVLRELARTFLTDKTIKLTRNNAVDLLHSVVPVSYCDHVLLDAHWEEQVARVSARFTAAKMKVPMAQVYSRKDSGVDHFLKALANTDGKPFHGKRAASIP